MLKRCRIRSNSNLHFPAFVLNTAYLSVLSPNAAKCGSEQLRTRTLFLQCQLNYHSASKPLYAELLNRGWLVNSASPFSFLLVFVRMKDGTLKLCCDYRKLNSKIIPDRHPSPKIQEIHGNFGGNQYFNILDQGKAFRQLHLKLQCRNYIAFITL